MANGSPSTVSLASVVSWKNHSDRRKLSSPRLAMLTASTLGVQMSWSILMSHGNPYLSSLGFSSALSSLVWLAGPMAGILIHPVVGAWSDACSLKSNYILTKLGPRKPFIIAGAIGTIVSMLILANIRDILEFFGSIFGVPQEKVKTGLGNDGDGSWLLKMAAIFWVYAANVAAQPLQVGVRAYVIDCTPPEQQVDATAWISRWNSFGAVLAFSLGSLELTTIFSWLGNSQFGALTIIDGFVLLTTIPLSFWSASDKTAVTATSKRDQKKLGMIQVWKQLSRTWKVMPKVSWIVCKIQFWSWMAWFPFLYYNTTYVARFRAPTLARHSMNATESTSLIEPSLNHDSALEPHGRYSDTNALAMQYGSFASLLFALISFGFTLVLPLVLRKFSAFSVSGLWFGAHAAFAVILGATILVRDYIGGSTLVACFGFSWAMTQWAPYELISTEISRLEEISQNGVETRIGKNFNEIGGAGAILGLHNVAVAGPQVVAALEASILFGILGIFQIHDDIGWVIRITGLASLGALWNSRFLLKIH